MSYPSCPHMGQMIATTARRHDGIGRKVVQGSLPPSGTQRSSTTTSCSNILWMTTMGRDILQSALRLCGQPRDGQMGSSLSSSSSQKGIVSWWSPTLQAKKVEVCWTFESDLLLNSSRMFMWSRRSQHCTVGQPESKKELVMVCSPSHPSEIFLG